MEIKSLVLALLIGTSPIMASLRVPRGSTTPHPSPTNSPMPRDRSVDEKHPSMIDAEPLQLDEQPSPEQGPAIPQSHSAPGTPSPQAQAQPQQFTFPPAPQPVSPAPAPQASAGWGFLLGVGCLCAVAVAAKVKVKKPVKQAVKKAEPE